MAPAPESHPLFNGKTPLELEEMSYDDLIAHHTRAVAYARKVDDEVLIHQMLRDIESGRFKADEFPSQATQRYKDCWGIALGRIKRKKQP